MTVDTKRVADLMAEGKSIREIADLMEGPQDGPSDQERQQVATRQALSSGAMPPGKDPGRDPWDDALGLFHSPELSNRSRDQRAAAALSKVMGAAVQGDDRVVYKHAGEDAASARDRWMRSQEIF